MLEKTENKIVVIIVTYNGMKWIERCLESLFSSKVKLIPVIIDNGSSDGTTDFIRSNFKDVKILPNTTNLGFGQGNNLGLKYALNINATHVILMNQDVYLQSDTISCLLKYDDRGTVLSPLHLNGDNSAFDHNFYLNTLPVTDRGNGIDDLNVCGQHKAEEISFVNAAFWFLPISVIRKVGGFNPLFYHYGEDNNYLHRLNYHGLKVKLVFETFISHDRVQFGNVKLFNSRQVYRTLLLNNLDINRNVLELCCINFIAIVKVPAFFMMFKFQRGQFQFEAILNILKNAAQISKSRNLEKLENVNWIL
ncbi:glycosyltransferase family 2 protein [Chryseobacterium sp. A301]